MKSNLFVCIVVLLSLNFSSCKTAYQNKMFKNIDSQSISNSINQLNNDYLIQPGDELFIKLYSRKGANLVEAIRTNVTNAQEATITGAQLNFIVSNSGMIDLPILGKIKVMGMNESQLKTLLEQSFTKDYVEPFVYIKVENRRVFLFKGNAGSVVGLNRTPTSIFEVLAKSGGLDRHQSSSDILIIRGDLKKPMVFKVDLSTMTGIQNSEITLQSNDIVYVPEKARGFVNTLTDIAPAITLPLSIIATTLSTILVITTLSK